MMFILNRNVEIDLLGMPLLLRLPGGTGGILLVIIQYPLLEELSFKPNVDRSNFAVESERPAVEIVERDRRAEIDADIKSFTRGKGGRHGALDRGAGDFLTIDTENHLARGAGLGDGGVDLDPVLSGCSFLPPPMYRSMIIMLYS